MASSSANRRAHLSCPPPLRSSCHRCLCPCPSPHPCSCACRHPAPIWSCGCTRPRDLTSPSDMCLPLTSKTPPLSRHYLAGGLARADALAQALGRLVQLTADEHLQCASMTMFDLVEPTPAAGKGVGSSMHPSSGWRECEAVHMRSHAWHWDVPNHNPKPKPKPGQAFAS